jgi:hypothetical protein
MLSTLPSDVLLVIGLHLPYLGLELRPLCRELAATTFTHAPTTRYGAPPHSGYGEMTAEDGRRWTPRVPC